MEPIVDIAVARFLIVTPHFLPEHAVARDGLNFDNVRHAVGRIERGNMPAQQN
jgi:hypothetical protein